MRIITPPASGSNITFNSSVDSSREKRSNFGNYLKDALDEVTKTEIDFKNSSIALINGGADNIHQVTIAAQKADISLSLALQVRNKLVDAYQEIMRMQI